MANNVTGGAGTVLVAMRGVTKAFGPLVANRDVSLSLERGTIHALVGENGAGKSTCVNMLYGLVRPDSGEIVVGGQVRAWRSPRDAIAAGLGMVHQHFMLSPTHSVLDNIILGAEPVLGSKLPLPAWLAPIDRDAARRRLQALMQDFNVSLDLEAPVGALPVGLQQRCEILKLLYRQAEVLILDEPTAVLTPQEVDDLFTRLMRLKDAGKTILVITHKLSEVKRFCDQVTVLRRGAVVGSAAVADVTVAQMAEMMVGRQLHTPPPPPPVAADAPVALRLADVNLRARGGKARLSAINLTVRSGEVVAIAGVEGNGQSELLALLAQPRRFFAGKSLGRDALLASGQLELVGKDARLWSTSKTRASGVGIVPEDRHEQGLLLAMDMVENLRLGQQRRPDLQRFGLTNTSGLRRQMTAAIKDYDIRPPEPSTLAGRLSGGNQQKLIMARELGARPRVLLCAHPTRGVDIGAMELIHAKIMAARAAGVGILLVSSELEEIMTLADRIVVFYGGAITAELRRGEADQATIGRYMGGQRQEGEGKGAAHA